MQENDHEMEYANITEEVNSNRPDEITGFIIEDVSVVSEEDPLAGTSPGTEDLPIPEQEPVVAVAEPVFQQPGFLSYLETTAGCCLATWLAILIVGGVVATAALCAQGFCNSSDKDPFTVTTNETTAVPGPPEFNRTTAIMDILPNFTLRSIQNISSPQHFAFQWLYDHPLLETLDDPRKQQLYALATLYYCLNGDDWSLYYFEQDDFLSYSVHECDWDGLFNNDSLACNLQREISEIDFSYAEMNGTIPSEISMLSELNTLILSDNCISGPIPTQVANLSRLRTLDISNNRVTGFLPTEVAVMTSLLRLDLSNNHFVGPFPLVLTSITELEILKLSNNDISGQMPSELGLMSSLRHLWMSGNHLVGKLPDALSMLSGLEELSIAKNQLTGPIHALGKLTTNLKQVDLSANLLSGSLPTELGLLTGLQFLHLFDNTLSGTLPTELGLLQNLTELCLNNNTLVGSIPTEIQQMDHFGMFDYSFNSGLNGSLPTGLDYWLRNPNNFKGTSVQVPYQPLQDIPFALSKDQYTYYYQDDDDDVDDVGENELQVNIIFDRFANDTEWSWEQLWLDFNVSNSTTTLLLHPQDQQNNDSSSSSWKTIASFSSGPPGYMVSYTLLMEDDVVYRLTLTDSSGVLDDDGDDDEMNRHDQRSFEVSVIAGGTNNKNASVLIWHLFGYQFHASAQVSLRRNPNGTIETFDERIA